MIIHELSRHHHGEETIDERLRRLRERAVTGRARILDQCKQLGFHPDTISVEEGWGDKSLWDSWSDRGR